MSETEKATTGDDGTDDTEGWLKRNFLAPAAVVKSRLVICSKCEHYNQTTRMCGVCHCIMPLKTRMAGMKCPKGKWGAFVRPPRPDGL